MEKKIVRYEYFIKLPPPPKKEKNMLMVHNANYPDIIESKRGIISMVEQLPPNSGLKKKNGDWKGVTMCDTK